MSIRKTQSKFGGELGAEFNAMWRELQSAQVLSVEGGEADHPRTGCTIKARAGAMGGAISGNSDWFPGGWPLWDHAQLATGEVCPSSIAFEVMKFPVVGSSENRHPTYYFPGDAVSGAAPSGFYMKLLLPPLTAAEISAANGADVMQLPNGRYWPSKSAGINHQSGWQFAAPLAHIYDAQWNYQASGLGQYINQDAGFPFQFSSPEPWGNPWAQSVGVNIAQTPWATVSPYGYLSEMDVVIGWVDESWPGWPGWVHGAPPPM